MLETVDLDYKIGHFFYQMTETLRKNSDENKF